MKPVGRCPEREQLLSKWAECSRRVTKRLDEQLAAAKKSPQSGAGFLEQIRLARNAESEACRAYYGHVNTHNCV